MAQMPLHLILIASLVSCPWVCNLRAGLGHSDCAKADQTCDACTGQSDDCHGPGAEDQRPAPGPCHNCVQDCLCAGALVETNADVELALSVMLLHVASPTLGDEASLLTPVFEISSIEPAALSAPQVCALNSRYLL